MPDERLEWLAQLYQPKKDTPAVIEFVDIAGLVKGASKGEGLGNKFLANIRRTDAIVHVVRCFDDSNVIHVEGGADPLRDIEIIDTGAHLRRHGDGGAPHRQGAARPARAATRSFRTRWRCCTRCSSTLNEGKIARSFECSDEDAALIADSDLLTLKPVIYAANLDEDGFADYGTIAYFQAVDVPLAERRAARCCRSAPSWRRRSPSWSRRRKRCSWPSWA